MKCLLVVFCIVSAVVGASLSGSYLPEDTSIASGISLGEISYGNNIGASQIEGLGGFSSGTSASQSLGGIDLGASRDNVNYDTVAHSGGSNDYKSSAGSGEVSFFPTIYHDAASFEHGNAEAYGSSSSEENQVLFYGDGYAAERSRLRIRVGAQPSKTRVVFVKSPNSGSSIIPEIVAPKSTSQDRTIVYVLLKKSEALGSITVPAALTSNIVKSKPEVYYLKYNNQHDASQVVAESLGGRAAGHGVQVLDKGSFVRTLDDASGSSVGGESSTEVLELAAPATESSGEITVSSHSTDEHSDGAQLGVSSHGTPGASGPY